MKNDDNHKEKIFRCRTIAIAAIVLAIAGLFQLRIIHKEFNLLNKYKDLALSQNKIIENSTNTLLVVGMGYSVLVKQHKQDQLKIELMDRELKRAHNGIDRLQCRLQYMTDGHFHLCDDELGGEPE